MSYMGSFLCSAQEQYNLSHIYFSLIIISYIFCVTLTFLLHQLIIFANTPMQLALQMSHKRGPWLEKAARLFADAPNSLKMTIPMVMMVKGFSDGEAKDNTLQQRVRLQAKEL